MAMEHVMLTKEDLYTYKCSTMRVVDGDTVDVMVDLDLNLWDAAATRLLVREAGGECFVREFPSGKLGLVLGSPALVRELAEWFT